MSGDVLIVFLTLGGAIVLFVTEWLRVDTVAVLVLLTLALTGVVSHDEALRGFSNEAVITMAAVLVLSGGLQRTGLANRLGQHVLGVVAGRSQGFLTAVLMLTVGLLSGIMNDIGVTALMLPVVVAMARRLELSPSKLLMPLAFGSLLGGMTTLIGTAPNILVSGVLRDTGHEPFEMFDFTPVGLCALVAGVAYMVFIGRHLLPDRDVRREHATSPHGIRGTYHIGQRLSTAHIPADSALVGATLRESRLRPALGFNVMAIVHDGQTLLAPGPDAPLQAGDRLVVEGRTERWARVRDWGALEQVAGLPALEDLVSDDVGFAEIVLEDGEFAGATFFDTQFRGRSGLRVLAIAHGPRRQARLTRLDSVPLKAGDRLLAIGSPARFEPLAQENGIASVRPIPPAEARDRYDLTRRLLRVRVPQGSGLAGRSLAESNLRDAFALTVIGLERDGKRLTLPHSGDRLEAGDILDIEGRVEELDRLAALQALTIDEAPAPELEALQSPDIGIGEIILSPGSELAGRTVRELHFHERHGLTVIAVWHAGRARRSGLRDTKIEHGDAVLVYGPRDKLALLAQEDDFIVLAEAVREVYREDKGPLAGLIMAAVLAAVAFGLVPIVLAALCGAAAMVVLRILKPNEVYEHIEWKALVLVACMLTLGVAMEKSGAAEMIAENVLSLLVPWGAHAVMAGIFLTSLLAAQFMPTAAVAVLMSRIVLSDVSALGVHPQSAAMVVAISSSCAFLSPVGHPVNLLVMGMGGYRFTDYAKVGFGLALVVFAVVMLVLPLFWPLTA